MNSSKLRRALLAAAAFGALFSASARAQETTPPANPSEQTETEDAADGVGFDEIVVTAAVGSGISKFQSSVSVSDLSAAEIINVAPRSTSEIFRNIPGIRSESSGGENNANIQVRGIPVTTGGAKFVQLQEDGLPVLSFGDITFGNSDNFLRYDTTVARVEAVRGGSSSTLASNAPGAVINLISKTGRNEGGSFGVTRGIGYGHTRVDFEYGAPIADGLHFHVGGFYRTGEGAREAGFNAEEGGQIKFNITKEFEKGYVRLYFKHLNDRTIPYLPAPVSLAGGNAAPIPGFDFRDQTLSTPFLLQNTRVDSGALNVTDIRDGVRALSTAIGAEFNFEVLGGWQITDKIRYSDNRGGFVGTFTGGVLNAANVAASFGGNQLRFANGPNAGQVITNPATLNGNGLVIDNLLFDVAVDDLSQFVNDLKIERSFAFAGGELSASAGYYKAIQQVETRWSFNFFLQEALGSNAALIDVFNTTGPSPVAQTVNGVRAFGIFDPTFDLSFDRDALYWALQWKNDRLNLDASFRFDNLAGTGTSNLASPNPNVGGFLPRTIDVNGDGNITPAETNIGTVDPTNLFTIDYSVDYFSYSFGANYTLLDNLALFARYSRGGVGNGDRLVLGGSGFNASGGLIDDGIGVDIVKQAEIGLKYRSRDAIPGNLNAFLTGFYADSEESNFEITSGLAIDRTTRAFGIEAEADYSLGGFSLTGGVTWTDSEIRRDAQNPLNIGNRPRRQAKLTYLITPSYTFRGHSVGANIVGTTSSFAQDNNVLELPGFAQVNFFLNFELAKGLLASLNVNNAGNAFGLTEAEEGVLPANGIVRARPINGRTISASLRYSF